MSAATRSRWLVAGGIAVIVAVAAVVSATALAAPPVGEPSLAVFDREPTDREREAEELAGRNGAGIGGGADTEVQARLILEYETEPGSPVREIWAVRVETGDITGREFTAVCLTTEPTGLNGGPLACMEEPDLARRGFIPLDQPRPTVVIDGEQRVVEWGPTGDARLVDPPTPPSDGERS